MLPISKMYRVLIPTLFILIIIMCPLVQGASVNNEHIKKGASWTYRFFESMNTIGSMFSETRYYGKTTITVITADTVEGSFRFALEVTTSLESGTHMSIGSPAVPVIPTQSYDTILLAFRNDTLFRLPDNNGAGDMALFLRHDKSTGQLPFYPLPAISSNVGGQKVTSTIQQPELHLLVDSITLDTTYFLNGTGVIYEISHQGTQQWQHMRQMYRLVSHNSVDFNVTEFLPDIDTLLTAVTVPSKSSVRRLETSRSTAQASYNLSGRVLSRFGVHCKTPQVIISKGAKQLLPGSVRR